MNPHTKLPYGMNPHAKMSRAKAKPIRSPMYSSPLGDYYTNDEVAGSTWHPATEQKLAEKPKSPVKAARQTAWREMYINLLNEMTDMQRKHADQLEAVSQAYEEKINELVDESEDRVTEGFEEAYKVCKDLTKKYDLSMKHEALLEQSAQQEHDEFEGLKQALDRGAEEYQEALDKELDRALDQYEAGTVLQQAILEAKKQQFQQQATINIKEFLKK